MASKLYVNLFLRDEINPRFKGVAVDYLKIKYVSDFLEAVCFAYPQALKDIDSSDLVLSNTDGVLLDQHDVFDVDSIGERGSKKENAFVVRVSGCYSY